MQSAMGGNAMGLWAHLRKKETKQRGEEVGGSQFRCEPSTLTCVSQGVNDVTRACRTRGVKRHGGAVQQQVDSDGLHAWQLQHGAQASKAGSSSSSRQSI